MVVFRMRGEIYPYLPTHLSFSLIHYHPFVGGWMGWISRPHYNSRAGISLFDGICANALLFCTGHSRTISSGA